MATLQGRHPPNGVAITMAVSCRQPRAPRCGATNAPSRCGRGRRTRARWLARRCSPRSTTSSDNCSPHWKPSRSTGRSIGTEPLHLLSSSHGSWCNTRRSLTANGASMPRSSRSTRRSAGVMSNRTMRTDEHTIRLVFGTALRGIDCCLTSGYIPVQIASNRPVGLVRHQLRYQRM
jgi:hypothetical protein